MCVYCNREKFRWAKLLRYSHYMDFPGNTFTVQSLYAVLGAKVSWEKLLYSSKIPQKFSPVKVSLFMV